MLVKCLRASLLFVLLLSPALTFQSDLSGPNIVPIRTRENPAHGNSANRPGGDTSVCLEPTLRVDSSLVLIPAQVTTREGSPIMDLKRKDFRIYEDGAEQEISYFAKDDAPVSVGLLLDSSGSMRNKKQKSSEAAAAFFRTANTEDEFFLIEFDERPRLAVPFTKDIDLLYNEISHTKPYGRTSLFDAIHMALGVMKEASHERKALVILSDGGDNRSRRTFTAIKGDVLEADVQLYAMGIFDPSGASHNSREEAEGPRKLLRSARGIDRRPAFPCFESRDSGRREHPDRPTAAEPVSAGVQPQECFTRRPLSRRQARSCRSRGCRCARSVSQGLLRASAITLL